MAIALKRLGSRTWAADRQLIELAKTMDLEAIAKKTGRKPESILKTAKPLGLSIRGTTAVIKRIKKIWFVPFENIRIKGRPFPPGWAVLCSC